VGETIFNVRSIFRDTLGYIVTTLHLGVIEIPYVDNASVGTGDVAEYLEHNYSLMETFAELHRDDIQNALVNSLEGAIENIFVGAPVSNDMFSDATNTIQELFEFEYIEKEEMAGIIGGVPTQAALDRASSRFKGGKASFQRPSFVDTGLFVASFRAWVD